VRMTHGLTPKRWLRLRAINHMSGVRVIEHEHATVSLPDALLARVLAHTKDQSRLTARHLWLKRAFVYECI
jgi:hypothetical protein